MLREQTENKSFGKQFFSGVAVLAISTFIVKVIGLFYKIPMMAYLGAEGMGYFNSAYDIYALFFVIATTGIPVAISILISESKTHGNNDNIKRIFRVSLILLGILGLIGTLLMSVFYKEFAHLINNNSAALCILAISPTVLLICIASAIRGYFQGNQIMAPTAISQVIEALGKLLLGLGFAIYAINRGYDIPTVAAFAVAGLTIGVLVSLVFLIIYKALHKVQYNEIKLNYQTEKASAIAKQLINIAVPITLSSTILSLTKVIDMTMILGRLNDIGYTQIQANEIYGSYSTMAVSIYNLPATLVSAIALPLVPMLASAIESRDKNKEKSIISSSMKMTALISFPTGLGISVFSKPILQLLFSSQSKEIEYTAPLLSILGISIFLSSMITLTNSILQSYKQVKKPIISMIIGTIIKIITSYVLIGIPHINIYGAPISTFFSTLIIVAVNIYFVIKESGRISSVFALFVKPFISAAISIVVGIGAYTVLSNFFSPGVVILAVIMLVAIIYALAVLKTHTLDKSEILMLPKGEKILKILTEIHLV